jgi:hypothetical protein
MLVNTALFIPAKIIGVPDPKLFGLIFSGLKARVWLSFSFLSCFKRDKEHSFNQNWIDTCIDSTSKICQDSSYSTKEKKRI